MKEAGTEESFDNVFDKYTSSQNIAQNNLISELKQIKRDNANDDLHVLYSDVKEAPNVFNLIQDDQAEQKKIESKEKEVDKELQKAITNRMFLNPTIRLIRFGMMYNSRTDLVMKINDIDRDQQLQ